VYTCLSGLQTPHPVRTLRTDPGRFPFRERRVDDRDCHGIDRHFRHEKNGNDLSDENKQRGAALPPRTFETTEGNGGTWRDGAVVLLWKGPVPPRHLFWTRPFRKLYTRNPKATI
jgi:hypothetical protein